MEIKEALERLHMSVSENIKKAREIKDITQTKAAELCGIPVSSYTKYEQGSLPGADAIIKIAKGLGVSTDELLLDPEDRSVQQELKSIFAEIDRLDENDKKAIKKTLKGILIAYQQDRL